MPTTISVSPAIPDKLVVNGCDLLNRDELSASQNQELQRYIDANAHLLGFLDKDKEETGGDGGATGTGRPLNISALPPPANYNSASSLEPSPRSGEGSGDARSGGGGSRTRPVADGSSSFSSPSYARPPSATASLNRAGSPYSMGGGSEYGGKRKGVSWSDVVEEPSPTRARSNSPPPASFHRRHNPIPRVFDDSWNAGEREPLRDYDALKQEPLRARAYDPYGPTNKTPSAMNGHGQDYNRHRAADPYDRSGGWDASNPWTGSLDHRGKRGGSRDRERPGWQGFTKPDLPTYSALERKPDDFNPFQTHLHREESIGLRKSQERDDTIKFSAYGDHKVSGIELKPKGWTGGELVTDPNIMKKSLKPRRFYYSPIGDGVVAADGIEMKRPPPDLTPRRYVYHQRYVEREPGEPGVRVTEDVWHEGDPRDRDGRGEGVRRGAGPGVRAWPDDGLGKGPGGPEDRGDGRGGPPRGEWDDGGGVPKWPGLGDDDDGRGPRRAPPAGRGADDGGSPIRNGGPGPGKFPVDDDDGLGRRPLGDGGGPRGDGGRGRPIGDDGRPTSALSTDSGGIPREGWSIEFITNPRELINQFGTETLTSIFDLKDHTPKTYTSVKESWSPAPPDLPATTKDEKDEEEEDYL